MASTLVTSASWDALSGVISRARARWRLRVALRGTSVVLGGALVAVLAGAWVMKLFRFAPASVMGVRIAVYATLAALVVRYLAGPLRRRADAARVALYLEEHDPSLDALVLSAVEAGAREAPESARSPYLGGRVLAAAATRAAASRVIPGIETRRMTNSLLVMVGTVLLGAIAIGFGPEFLRTGARLLVAPAASVRRVVFIGVQPGDAKVARGGDIAIRARLHGLDAPGAVLVMQRDTGRWERLPMTAARDSASFVIRLFDVRVRTAYYVEAGGVRSPTYHLDVVDFPHVKQISLEYRYPAYTGLAPMTVKNGGDIAAPVGTSVIVRATTSAPVSGAQLAIEGRPPIPMTVGADGVLTGTIPVTAPGFYKIELDTPGGARPGSLDYTIDVIEDHDPTIAFLKPGRDVTVRGPEDVFTQIEATDDYGVGSVELHYSVNGGPEQVAVLHGGAARKDVIAGYTFFLGKLGLQLGDVVSYYAQAADNDAVHGAKVVTTDIYFINIKPSQGKDENSGQGQQGGGGGGGQNNNPPPPSVLLRKQREIVAGTFKADRERRRLTPNAVRENLSTLSLAQSRLRDRVDGIAQQLVRRGLADGNPTFRVITDELSKAAEEMSRAEATLGKSDLRAALSPEQRALQHLQRADAAFRSLPRQSSGSKQSNQSQQDQEPTDDDDLDNLFDAKQNQLSKQVETNQPQAQPNGASPMTDKAVDEIAEKLRQLAMRQQQERERPQQQQQQQPPQQQQQQPPQQQQQQQQQQNGSQQSSDGGETQRRLADQLDRMARQLQQLARENPNDRALRESARQLAQAADAMRRAAAGAQPDALARALDKLNEARRLLEQRAQKGRGSDSGRQQALDRARDLLQGAESLGDRLAQQGQQPGRQPGQSPGNSDAERQQRGTPQAGQRGGEQSQPGAPGSGQGSAAGQYGGNGQATGGASKSHARGSEGLPSASGGQGSPEEWAQLERELGEQRKTADAIRQDLQRQGVDTKDLARVIEQMRKLEAAGNDQAPSAARLQADIVEGLKAWEFGLRQQIDPDRTARPTLGGTNDVPPDFRALVEEYYRLLGKAP